jgi:uncharacterized protein
VECNVSCQLAERIHRALRECKIEHSIFPVDQAFRDLSWLLNAPALVNPGFERFAGKVVNFDQQQLSENREWLNRLEQDLEPLAQWLIKKPDKQLLRLGRYAEYLLEFYLRFGPCFNFVAANLPIRMNPERLIGDRTTVGEIDFLLTQAGDVVSENKSPINLHWELAVKYFLCLDVDDPQPTDFVGPEAIEVFEYKLQKLFERQLCNQPPAPYNDRSWQSAAFTRGWIFYPLSRPNQQVAWLSPNHLRGTWLSVSQLRALPDQHFEILNRQRWLSPAFGVANTVLNRDQLEQTIRALWAVPNAYQQHPSPVLVAAMQPKGSLRPLTEPSLEPKVFEEHHRLFVVPDQWIGFDLQAQRVRPSITNDRLAF